MAPTVLSRSAGSCPLRACSRQARSESASRSTCDTPAKKVRNDGSAAEEFSRSNRASHSSCAPRSRCRTRRGHPSRRGWPRAPAAAARQPGGPPEAPGACSPRRGPRGAAARRAWRPGSRRGERRVRDQLGGRRARGVAQLRRLAAQRDEPLRLGPHARGRQLPLALRDRRARPARERSGPRLQLAALADATRQHLVPAGRTVPPVDVRALASSSRPVALPPAVPQRQRLVHGVQEQLGQMQGRLAALGEAVAQSVLESARQLPLGASLIRGLRRPAGRRGTWRRRRWRRRGRTRARCAARAVRSSWSWRRRLRRAP